MKIPFTIKEFLNVFKHYNNTIFPMQIILLLLAVIAVILIIKKHEKSNLYISLILSFFWLWMGIVYHILFFSSINKGAIVFGILYILQAFLFFITGVLKAKLSFKFRFDIYGIVGSVYFLYALIIYPILGYFLGHIYPRTPTFGAPCPTTIFTFGVLLFASKKIPKYLLIIPLIWSIIGFSAAINLHITEDLGLFLAGLLGVLLIVIKDRKRNNVLNRS